MKQLFFKFFKKMSGSVFKKITPGSVAAYSFLYNLINLFDYRLRQTNSKVFCSSHSVKTKIIGLLKPFRLYVNYIQLGVNYQQVYIE